MVADHDYNAIIASKGCLRSRHGLEMGDRLCNSGTLRFLRITKRVLNASNYINYLNKSASGRPIFIERQPQVLISGEWLVVAIEDVQLETCVIRKSITLEMGLYLFHLCSKG